VNYFEEFEETLEMPLIRESKINKLRIKTGNWNLIKEMIGVRELFRI